MKIINEKWAYYQKKDSKIDPFIGFIIVST